MRISFVATALLLASSLCTAQQKNFQYRRKVSAVPVDGWYAIKLPPATFKHLNDNYSDVRIWSITDSDTVEVPYLLKVREDEVTNETVRLRELNKSTKDNNLFITFEVPEGLSVNYTNLQVEEENFDAYITLEGSHSQRDWYTVAEKQRILAIHRPPVEFRSTEIRFPPSNYRYLRMKIESSTPLHVTSASFRKNSIKSGAIDRIDQQWKVVQDKPARQTRVDVAFRHEQPANKIGITLTNESDYYRPYTLEVLQDSAETPKGWIFYYTPVANGYLTSLQQNEIQFTTQDVSKVRLIIHNADNPPLKINDLTVWGPSVELIAKLKAGNDYHLHYGNEHMSQPQYDLAHFTDQIPDSTATIGLDEEEYLGTPAVNVKPFLENKAWLWAAMGAVIAILGLFTLRMMRGK
ncbi:MAG TPA: DUF3999 family protein [Ohtaekwangia sp.]|nr:DUF3999 family protein [Ohtaekwangia sp.]